MRRAASSEQHRAIDVGEYFFFQFRLVDRSDERAVRHVDHEGGVTSDEQGISRSLSGQMAHRVGDGLLIGFREGDIPLLKALLGVGGYLQTLLLRRHECACAAKLVGEGGSAARWCLR